MDPLRADCQSDATTDAFPNEGLAGCLHLDGLGLELPYRPRLAMRHLRIGLGERRYPDAGQLWGMSSYRLVAENGVVAETTAQPVDELGVATIGLMCGFQIGLLGIERICADGFQDKDLKTETWHHAIERVTEQPGEVLYTAAREAGANPDGLHVAIHPEAMQGELAGADVVLFQQGAQGGQELCDHLVDSVPRGDRLQHVCAAPPGAGCCRGDMGSC